MITSLYNFSILYKKTTRLQDSINQYITGGDGVPLLTAQVDPNISISNNVFLQFFISNSSSVPIYNIHYTFWNPIELTNTERDIYAIPSQSRHLIASDYNKEIFTFHPPNNKDTIEFYFEINWTSRHLKHYFAFIDLFKLSNGKIQLHQIYKDEKGILIHL